MEHALHGEHIGPNTKRAPTERCMARLLRKLCDFLPEKCVLTLLFYFYDLMGPIMCSKQAANHKIISNVERKRERGSVALCTHDYSSLL